MIRTKNTVAGFAAVALTATAMIGGCGGQSDGDKTPAAKTEAEKVTADQTAVRQVLTDLQTASRKGDGKRICNQIFTPKLADSVTTSAKSGSCAKEVKAKLFSAEARIAVQNVDVSNTANASATIKEATGNTSTVFLVKQSGRWRIRSVQAA
jgi:phage baseplate assembly protein W